MHKIDAHVGNNAANRFASYMNVFPCTLLLPHVATWDTVLVDHPLAAQDMASFQQAIRHFIAMHATDEDRHELLDYIHSIDKPCKMDIQKYYSCLHELDQQEDLLPGNDLPLTEDQLHQAFFDGMRTLVILFIIPPLQTCLDSFVCNKRLLIIAKRLTSNDRVECTASATVAVLSHRFTRKQRIVIVKSRMMLSIESRSLRMEPRVQGALPNSPQCKPYLGQALC
jgi:hypothetical protein